MIETGSAEIGASLPLLPAPQESVKVYLHTTGTVSPTGLLGELNNIST